MFFGLSLLNLFFEKSDGVSDKIEPNAYLVQFIDCC
jgi:hypothetical protein